MSRYNAHTEPIFKVLRLMNVDDIFKYFSLKFYFKYKNGSLPNYFYSMFCTNDSIHEYGTRQAHNLHIPQIHSALSKNCIRSYLPKLVQDISPSVITKVNTHSYHGFSNYTKSYFLDRYDPVCHIPDCYICDWA